MLLIKPDTGQIIRANKAAEAFYGYNSDEFSRMTIQQLNMLSEDEVKKKRLLALNHKQNHFTFPHRLSSGEERIIEVYSSPIQWEDENILFSIIHDVTEQELAKVNLSQSEERFRSLFEMSPDTMILVDVETGLICDVNSAAEKMFKVPARKLIGQSFTILHPEYLREETQKKFNEFVLFSEIHEKTKPIEFVALSFDGIEIPIEITANLLSFKNKKFSLGIFRDISDRLKIQRILQESEERLKFAFFANNDGLWDWDLITNKVFFSSRWKEMLGYSENDLLEDRITWEKLVHQEDFEDFKAKLERHLSGETEFFASEHRMMCRDGSYKWILDRGKVVSRTSDGIPLRIVGSHSDIDQRKKVEIENQLLLNQLSEAIGKVKLLSGLLPICSSCKKIRDDNGYWNQIEQYIKEHSEAIFSHGICPDCARRLYPDLYK